MDIAVIGAGIAGCHLGYRLAAAGMDVTLFDPRAPWEKPCGGGLTAKVWKDFPEVLEQGVPTRRVDEIVVVSPSGRRAELDIDGRIRTVSRYELGKALLERSLQAGARLVQERVEKVRHCRPGWTTHTGKGESKADYLVGADGAASIVRKSVARRFPRQELMLTYGRLISGEPRTPAVIRFIPDYQGYAWLFPRPEGYSAGIFAPALLARRDPLLRVLDEFLNAEFEIAEADAPPGGRPFAALLPAMYQESFMGSEVAGTDWALVGDASGAADPISGEGIYWALKSADLLADSLINSRGRDYAERWMEMATPDIARAAHMRFTIYVPRYLRLLALLLNYSPLSCDIAREMIDGTQDYASLKPRIARALPRVAGEVLLNRLRKSSQHKNDQ